MVALRPEPLQSRKQPGRKQCNAERTHVIAKQLGSEHESAPCMFKPPRFVVMREISMASTSTAWVDTNACMCECDPLTHARMETHHMRATRIAQSMQVLQAYAAIALLMMSGRPCPTELGGCGRAAKPHWRCSSTPPCAASSSAPCPDRCPSSPLALLSRSTPSIVGWKATSTPRSPPSTSGAHSIEC